MINNNFIRVKSLQNKFYKTLKQGQLVLKRKSFRKVVKSLKGFNKRKKFHKNYKIKKV